MDNAKNKGCDGIIPMNVTTYTVDTATKGFTFNDQHQITYNTWIANTAIAKDLTVGLLNDPA